MNLCDHSFLKLKKTMDLANRSECSLYSEKYVDIFSHSLSSNELQTDDEIDRCKDTQLFVRFVFLKN